VFFEKLPFQGDGKAVKKTAVRPVAKDTVLQLQPYFFGLGYVTATFVNLKTMLKTTLLFFLIIVL